MTDASNDFGKLFEDSINGVTTQINTGAKVTGIVTDITDSTVYVDLGARMSGYIDKKDLLDKNGELKAKVGDKITAFNMGWTDEGIKLQVRISGVEIDSAIQDAYEAKIPIEGKVMEERKGGFGVVVAGSNAFCPFSQIDARGVKKEPAEYIGQTYSFLITEFSEEGRNIVLSRRKIMEEEAQKMREYLKDMLKEGDIRDATVVKVMPFGAFADLGGIEGLIPVSEISWTRGISAEESLQAGQKIQVKIIGLDWGDGTSKERITLSLKQATKSPWQLIADGEDTRYTVGAKLTGKIVRLADFGVFVELEPGLDGLAHISQLGQETRIEKPSDVCKIGDEVEVTILAIDGERRRISLCFGEPKEKNEKPAELNLEQEAEVAAATRGEKLEGEVDSLKPFGVFVKLPNGQTGLLHISQCGIEERGPAGSRELYRKFPIHSKVEVIVKEINGNKISLTLPEIVEQEIERNTVNDYKDAASTSFGSMDDVFGKLRF